MKPLHGWPITDIVHLFEAHEFSLVDPTTQQTLARIDAVDDCLHQLLGRQLAAAPAQACHEAGACAEGRALANGSGEYHNAATAKLARAAAMMASPLIAGIS